MAQARRCRSELVQKSSEKEVAQSTREETAQPSLELIRDTEVRLNQSQKNKGATAAAQSSATTKTNTPIGKRDYASVAASKQAKIPEKP